MNCSVAFPDGFEEHSFGSSAVGTDRLPLESVGPGGFHPFLTSTNFPETESRSNADPIEACKKGMISGS
jgi:hypothetical protein